MKTIDVRVTFRVSGSTAYALAVANAIVKMLSTRANVLDKFRIQTKEVRA
jgi:hypothetical protein